MNWDLIVSISGLVHMHSENTVLVPAWHIHDKNDRDILYIAVVTLSTGHVTLVTIQEITTF